MWRNRLSTFLNECNKVYSNPFSETKEIMNSISQKSGENTGKGTK